jgi:hypothetical protein
MRKRKWIGKTEVARLGKIARAKWRQASEYILKAWQKRDMGEYQMFRILFRSILSAVTNLQRYSQTREENAVS